MRLKKPNLEETFPETSVEKYQTSVTEQQKFSLEKDLGYGFIQSVYRIKIGSEVVVTCKEENPARWVFMELAFVQNEQKLIQNLLSYTKKIRHG